MNFKKFKKKYFKSSEEVISMFLGLVIVLVVGGLIFNYFQKNKGSINIPGSSDEVALTDGMLGGTGKYEVTRGDSLWKIAMDKYGNGYAWTEIASINELNNPSAIEIGQELVIPEKVMVNGEEVRVVSSMVDDSVSVSPGSEYQVVRGDSLWKIAVRAYGDGYQWVKIWEENKSEIPNANGLEIGMMLMIPELN